MHALVLAGILTTTTPLDVISTLSLEGDITAEGGDYALHEFQVPEGTVEFTVQRTYETPEDDIIDFGIRDQDSQRGWGGGLAEPAVIGVEESSRGYVIGPIRPGTWYVDIGKAKLIADSVHYTIEIEFRDAPTLTPRPRAAFEPVVLEDEARWYAGDFHVHDSESGDATGTFEQLRDLARMRGLDFMNLSDHNIVAQHPLQAAFQQGVDDVLFLRGSEVTTYSGHGNTVGNTSYIDHHIGRDGHTAVEMLQQIVDDGALFIVNHPKLALGNSCIGCAWEHPDTPWDQVTGIELQTGAYVTLSLFYDQVLAMWDDLLDQGYRITGVSGSDDHRAPLAPEGIESQLGTPTSMVFAQELSEAGIMQGVREGRVVVKLRGPDDPMVELSAVTDNGDMGMIGDTVNGTAVRITAHVTGGEGMVLRVVASGVAEEGVIQIDSNDFLHTFERPIEDAGRYRVHVAEGAGDVVVTNHIFVERGTGDGFPGDPDAGPGAEDDGGDAADDGGGDGDSDDGCGCRSGGSGGAWSSLGIAAAAAFALRRRRSRR